MLTKSEVLDRYYLDARSRIVETAATLDRHDRMDGEPDERVNQLYDALQLLAASKDSEPNRCERILNLLSED